MLTKTELIQEIKGNLRLSLPFIASQTIYSISGFVGTAMVAHLGQTSLAASVLVSMLWFTLSILFFGILNAVTVAVSHLYGAKDTQGIDRSMGQAYIIGLFMSVIMILILFYLPHLLPYSHQPAAVLSQAKHYIYSYIWTVPSLIYLIITEQFLGGIGKAKVVLTTSIIIVPLEIITIYILMFGKFGMPALGISAIGFGFALSYFITSVGLTLYICMAKAYKKYHIYSYIHQFHLQSILSLAKIGLPIGIAQTIEVSGFAVLTLWMGHFGTTMLAAHQIVMQFLGLMVTLLFAMSQAVTVRLGHHVGAGEYLKLSRVIIVGLGLSLILISLVVSGFNIFDVSLLGLDIDIYDPHNATLIADTLSLFEIVAIWLIIENFRIIAQGALRGLKDTLSLMTIAVIGFWIVGLPMAYLLGFHTNMGGHGLWWGFSTGITVGAIISLARLYCLLRKPIPLSINR